MTEDKQTTETVKNSSTSGSISQTALVQDEASSKSIPVQNISSPEPETTENSILKSDASKSTRKVPETLIPQNTIVSSAKSDFNLKTDPLLNIHDDNVTNKPPSSLINKKDKNDKKSESDKENVSDETVPLKESSGKALKNNKVIQPKPKKKPCKKLLKLTPAEIRERFKLNKIDVYVKIKSNKNLYKAFLAQKASASPITNKIIIIEKNKTVPISKNSSPTRDKKKSAKTNVPTKTRKRK